MDLFDQAEALKTDMEDVSLHLNDSNLLDDNDLQGRFQYGNALLSGTGKRGGVLGDPELAYFDDDNFQHTSNIKKEIGNTIDFGSSRECH